MAVTKLQFRGNPLALLLPMVLLSLGHSLINSVPFQTVQGCTKKQYFDISRMICRPCGAKQQKSKDGPVKFSKANDKTTMLCTSCVCLPGYKLISNKGGPFIRCAKCPALQSAVTQDGWSCIRCPQGVILDNERKCRCPMGNIMVERHINGALLTQVQCQPCSTSRPSFTMPDLSAKHCIRCHETFITTTQSCDCKSNVLTGGLCFRTYPKTLATSVVTNIIYSKNLKVSSAWFASHLKASAIACLRFANLTACQALGNMCVMTMNSINILTPSNDACGLYQTIFKKTIHLGISHSINSWRKTLPWLYYDSHIDGSPSRILHQEPFQTVFHLKSFKRMELQFVVAIYDARGYFLNWAKATGGILQLCPDTLTKLNAAYIFGITYQQQCTLPVSMLLSKYRDIQFYDLYVLHKGENDDDQLHPVAVRNVNLQYNGKFVNTDDAENNWYLTRRIFLVDTLAGREDNLNRQPKVIRVANDIKIRINLVPNSLHGKIFPPILIISYVNIKIQNPEQQTIPISFYVEYKMDLSTANQNTEIALGFLCGLSTICSMLKTASWKRRIGSQMIDIQTILKFLLFYAGDLANAFFLVTFGTGLYWLTFFKGQRIVSVLLPTPSQEVHFISCVVSAFALKVTTYTFMTQRHDIANDYPLLYFVIICIQQWIMIRRFQFLQLLHKLGIQLTVDIFFIDWERPKGKIVKSVAGGGDIKTAPAPVSIWRTYFVANEWNNIQTIRKINPIFQIFVVLFFLEVVGFANLTSMSPYSNLKRTAESDVVPPSRILRFGMASGIWLTVGVIQVVFCTGIYERFVEDRISQFIDVCSISNISVMIFSHRCFGYYIHGRSVHGQADTSMEEMNLNLKREADNLCGQRGLIPNTEIETFQIFTTNKIREQYDKIREPIHWSSGSDQLLNHADDFYERKMKAYNTTNKFLGSFIDHAIRDMDYIVQDKLLLERIIGMELHEPIDKTIFYNDEKLSFTDVLYYGNESTLLIFDTLFFCVVDLAAQNFILAAFLTYIQQKVIQFIRLAIGRKNLATKTLVDERFLL